MDTDGGGSLHGAGGGTAPAPPPWRQAQQQAAQGNQMPFIPQHLCQPIPALVPAIMAHQQAMAAKGLGVGKGAAAPGWAQMPPLGPTALPEKGLG
eukprot:5543383-Pyramimonas_sp.AAC.1